jgi:hypothetical protein
VNARGQRTPPVRLSYTGEEAAAALGLGRSLFYAEVAPHVRCVKVGSRRLYPLVELEKFLRDHASYEADAS